MIASCAAVFFPRVTLLMRVDLRVSALVLIWILILIVPYLWSWAGSQVVVNVLVVLRSKLIVYCNSVCRTRNML